MVRHRQISKRPLRWAQSCLWAIWIAWWMKRLFTIPSVLLETWFPLPRYFFFFIFFPPDKLVLTTADCARRRQHLQRIRLHLLRLLRSFRQGDRKHGQAIPHEQGDQRPVCIQEGWQGRASRRPGRAPSGCTGPQAQRLGASCAASSRSICPAGTFWRRRPSINPDRPGRIQGGNTAANCPSATTTSTKWPQHGHEYGWWWWWRRRWRWWRWS